MNISTTPPSDIIAQNAKVGYNNIYQNGNLTELNITILGDPYWIGLSSDNQLYAGNSDTDIINANPFPNFSFIMKTPIGQKEDGTICLLTMDGRQQYKNMYGTNQQEFNAFLGIFGTEHA